MYNTFTKNVAKKYNFPEIFMIAYRLPNSWKNTYQILSFRSLKMFNVDSVAKYTSESSQIIQRLRNMNQDSMCLKKILPTTKK